MPERNDPPIAMNLSLPPLRHAIVAVIEDRGEVLFIERAEGDTYAGYWSGVTGAMEPGETQQQALIREVREEVGLEVEPVRKLWESVTRGAHFLLHWWQARLVSGREVTPDPAEVSDWRWVKLSEIGRQEVMFSDSRHFFRDIWPLVRCPDAGEQP